MNIYCRYYGPFSFSGGADHPHSVQFVNSMASLDAEDAAHLLLTYPHLFRNQPWDAVDMLDTRDAADPKSTTPTLPSTPFVPITTPVPANTTAIDTTDTDPE